MNCKAKKEVMNGFELMIQHSTCSWQQTACIGERQTVMIKIWKMKAVRHLRPLGLTNTPCNLKDDKKRAPIYADNNAFGAWKVVKVEDGRKTSFRVSRCKTKGGG